MLKMNISYFLNDNVQFSLMYIPNTFKFGLFKTIASLSFC